MKHKLSAFKIVWYGVHLAWAFLWIIPEINGPIYTKCVRNYLCARYLRVSGWPFYYLVDSADNQWRDIRGNLPLLTACLVGISLLHFILRNYNKGIFTSDTPSLRANKSSWFRVIVGVIFLFVLHKWHMYIILVVALVTYLLAMSLKGRRGAVLITWLFAISVLLMKESYRIQHLLDSEVRNSPSN